MQQQRHLCLDYDDITTDSSKDGHGWWYKDVEELLGSLMPDKQEYLSIYGRLLVNSFALRVDNKGEEENIGTGNNKYGMLPPDQLYLTFHH